MMSQKLFVFGLVCLIASTSALPLAQDLGLVQKQNGLIGEIINVDDIVASGLEELEDIASGLPIGSELLKLIESLLALLKKELGDLEGSGSGSGFLDISFEHENNGQRNHGRGNGRGQGNEGNDDEKNGRRSRGQHAQ